MQVAVPFAELGVGKVAEAPLMNLLVPAQIFVVARERPGQQRGNNGFAVRPPEFHVVPILLDWQPAQVAKIEDAALLFIPAALPHPVENRQPEAHRAARHRAASLRAR